jgi:hypothetical protein
MANTANVTILPLEPAHVTSIPKGVDVTLRAQLTSIAGLALPAGFYKIGIAVKDVTSLGLHILDEDVSLRNSASPHLELPFSTNNAQQVLSVEAKLGTEFANAGQTYPVTLTLFAGAGNPLGKDTVLGQATAYLNIAANAGDIPRVLSSKDTVATPWTDDVILFELIKRSTLDLGFNNYKEHMDFLLCGADNHIRNNCLRRLFQGDDGNTQWPLTNRRFLPFNDTDAYRLLKVATEAFVMVKSGVNPTTFKNCVCGDEDLINEEDVNEVAESINALVNFPKGNAKGRYRQRYIRDLNEPIDAINTAGGDDVLPYLYLISQKLKDLPLKDQIFPVFNVLFGRQNAQKEANKCTGLIRYKITCPIMIELIWSYWHEQGMHAQTMYAIRDRFQNRRTGPAPDPLAAMEIGALRPLNNILWGFIQDEQHRLTITRRCYEYDHHYGLTLQGKAVPSIQPVDSRSKFLEAFHNLLYLCTVFFKEDDDTNRKADAFPVLNAIKEVHFLLSEGAHNQFGDLPVTSRIEMLLEQWLLARPEMREFLPSRESIAYPEDWMGPVDCMKTIQGWTNTSSLYFHDLAVFGEQILLSIRYNNWSQINDRFHAANWAKIWRSEIQGYMHAYRTVTGVDITVEPTEPRLQERKADPGVLLAKRLDEQRRIGTAVRGGLRLPASPTAGLRLPAPRKV